MSGSWKLLYAKRLLDIARKHPSVKRVAGQGLHWTVELHGPDWRAWTADTTENPIASRVAARAMDAGAVIGTSGEQTSLFLAPPLIINAQECRGGCWKRSTTASNSPTPEYARSGLAH